LTKLYVGNLPFAATPEAVHDAFAPHGKIESLSLMTDKTTGPPQRFGFLEMASADAARALHAMNGKDFGGRPLKVSEARERDRLGAVHGAKSSTSAS
jgi:RNA recognition motif-containing protein